MRFAVLAHSRSETNVALAAAAASLGVDGDVLSPRDALRLLGPGDVALGRLDIREGLDGIESGSTELERLSCAGVTVLNPPSVLAATHDKLLTSRVLRLNGLPHPHTWLVPDGAPSVVPEMPLVLKPRFGSWGRDVVLCNTPAEFEAQIERFRYRDWFREHGALAQELVPPLGWDLRIVVAGGRVVGAARRFAAPGEWRTNVALGGHVESVAPPPVARTLALSAVAAVGGDLVGVDLLPTSTGYVVSELNGAVDFRPPYALDASNVYEETVLQLLRAAADRRAMAAVGA